MSKHTVPKFSVISFAQHTLTFITSLFLDRMFAQSRNFYEISMILRLVLSDPAKSSLEKWCMYWWIRLPEQRHTQKNITIMKKKSVIFFSAVYNKNPCDSTIYILLFLPSWTTSWIFSNAETQQHHASQIRQMQLLLKTIRKKGYKLWFWFQVGFCLKMAAILDTIVNSSTFWLKQCSIFNHLYHLDSKKPYKVNIKCFLLRFLVS